MVIWLKVGYRKLILFILVLMAISAGSKEMGDIKLPEPNKKGNLSLEEVLLARRSRRDFKKGEVSLNVVSQILWSGYGIKDGFSRTSPSAGATFPLEIYVVIGEVKGIEKGVYKYIPSSHSLRLITLGDKRTEIAKAALGQGFIRDAQIVVVIVAVFERTTRRYGERGVRYVYMEAGHVGQNIYLQAEALGLGTVAVGAFSDSEIKKILGCTRDEEPLYIFPIGIRN